MNIQLSIIIPIYNSQLYLKKCLKSLLKINLDAIEIIIVNDGSNDNSMNIVNEMKDKFVYIKIINQINQGLSTSRNNGINASQGKYIMFLDSDDFINEVDLINICNFLEVNNIDFITFRHNVVDNNYNIISTIKDFPNLNILNKNEVFKDFFINEVLPGFSCSKIYKKELFKNSNIYFPINMYFEDMPTLVKLIGKSKNIAYSNIILYNYVQHNESITNKVTIKRDLDYFKSINMVIENLNKLKVDNSLYINWYFNKLSYLYKNTQYNKVKKEIAQIYIIKFFSILLSVNIRLKEKIKVVINLLIYFYNSNFKICK